ncbi:MAG TPA: RidA family protein [Candidatus Binataceae bacterium]|nr:RidA family protein [Candidatus Binataceae bacterium]
MSKRRSIEVEGFSHGATPIPAASRIGNMIASGGIAGLDTATGKIPDGLEAQVTAMFANVRKVVEAGGGNVEDIIKMTLWVRDRAARAVIDPQWTKMFPDPHSRPARHTLVYQLPDPMLVQCDFLAILE